MRFAPIIMFTWLLWGAGAVAAHAEFVAARPAPGATTEDVNTIALTFSEPVENASIFLLSGNTEYTVNITRINRDDFTVHGQIQNDLAPGVYQVVWTVTSEDEHPITGSYSFELTPSDNRFPVEIAGGLVLILVLGGFSLMLWRRQRPTRDEPL
ncbi:MAG: copper resistance protein CopC [Anaerolineales bacterium]